MGAMDPLAEAVSMVFGAGLLLGIAVVVYQAWTLARPVAVMVEWLLRKLCRS